MLLTAVNAVFALLIKKMNSLNTFFYND